MAKTDQHSPEGFYAYAHSYARAADVLLEGDLPETRTPALFLLAHALELALKSFLLFNGVAAQTLSRKPYRHDLKFCLKEALSRGLLHGRQLATEDQQVILTVGKLFEGKELQYLYEYPKSLPDIDMLQQILRRVLIAVFENVSSPYFSITKG